MIRGLSAIGALLFALLSLRCACATSTGSDEVYVWQRQWSPALRDALLESRDLFGGVRILVAQAGRGDRWIETQADPRVFAGDTRTRIAVIRYDGAGDAPDIARLRAYLDKLLPRWRSQGAAFAGIEIDYDCASARLADYAIRLHALRAQLPADVRLSITALPAWLQSTDLESVLEASDASVLQLHAVRDPHQGLFDAVLAERWARAYAARTPTSFRVALPAYGVRVAFTEDGRVRAVEGEANVDAASGEDARELETDPRAVVDLLARMRATPPAHWDGVLWFRLPLAGDRRAWTLPALREVVAGKVPSAQIDIDTVAQANGAIDLVAVNRGGIAAAAPAFRIAGGACTAHDVSTGWSVQSTPAGEWRYVPVPSMRVAPSSRRAAGWIRCATLPQVIIEDRDAGNPKP